MSKHIKDWKIVRHEILRTLLRLEPDILNDRSLEFRFGNIPNVAIALKYGVIAINRDDLLVLGLKQSIPQDLAMRLIDALTKHCMNQKMNMGVIPLDGQGKPIDTDQRMAIRV